MAATEGTTRQRGPQMQLTSPVKLLKRPATSRWEKDEDLELMGHDHVSFLDQLLRMLSLLQPAPNGVGPS